MTTRRDAILNGTARAAELHAELGIRDGLRDGDRPVDVLDAIRKLGVLVLFRPLDSLLGAYLPTTGQAPGMMLTTRRTLHIQRFTAAHELGHHALGHRAMSLDKDVGFVARGDQSGHDLQEVEADAFASAFLLPDWLLVAHARRHGWGKRQLAVPDVAYQLSLRLGASYAATCWALLQANIVGRDAARHLVDTPPKHSKQRAIPDIERDKWYPDVWQLSERDRGVQVLGNPDDVLVLALKEHVANGYMWDTSSVESAGLIIEKDERQDPQDEALGGPITRRLVVQGPAHGRLRIEEKRPWDQEAALNSFELDLTLLGPEAEGLPRAARPLAA
jgi:Zn-dependent peptidase ImmA (M78 family)/predicted secreted protein